jgi:glutamine synthetase
VSVLPKLPRDAGDRNRTSPFAFTGNKFEFRAVGGSQSIAGPNTVLNTIVAESLDYVATTLENAVKAKGMDLNKAVQELLPTMLKESKKVIFNGDNYTDDWHNEAERRGLPNLKNTVDSLPVITRKDSIDLFTKYKVYTERELQSRLTILSENYVKTVNIEGQLTSLMARTQILPASLKYQADVAQAVNATKAAGVENGAQLDLLKTLTRTISDFQAATATLDKALAHHADGDAYAHAKSMRDHVLPAMNAVRGLGDKLESMVADEYWPLPTYREMLFIK